MFRTVPAGGNACSEHPKPRRLLDRAETEPVVCLAVVLSPRGLMHATPARKPFNCPGCVFELKYDVVTRLVAVLVLGALVSGCVHVGATITNAPTIPDCIPGSATKPCQ